MKSKVLILAVSILLLTIIFYSKTSNPIPNSKKMHKLTVSNQTVLVEIADTQELQSRGLSGRVSLEENFGMYFVFQESAKRSIWMKDMKFPIDVIWIRAGSVVEITENVIPLGRNLPIITSQENVDAFLEIKAGFTNKNRIKVGERVGVEPL